MAKTKSLYELKQEQMKSNKPNTLTDSDYFLRDKEAEAKLGYPNTIDITGATNGSAEEALQKKLVLLEAQIESMTKDTASKPLPKQAK